MLVKIGKYIPDSLLCAGVGDRRCVRSEKRREAYSISRTPGSRRQHDYIARIILLCTLHLQHSSRLPDRVVEEHSTVGPIYYGPP